MKGHQPQIRTLPLKDDGILQNIPDDFDPKDVIVPDSMLKAIDEFNEANKKLVSWEPDFTRAIIIEGGEVVG